MVNRNIKKANAKLFNAQSSITKKNYWFISNDQSKNFFIKANIIFSFRLSSDKIIFASEYNNCFFLCTYGLNVEHKVFESVNELYYSNFFNSLIINDESILPGDNLEEIKSNYGINHDSCKSLQTAPNPRFEFPDHYDGAVEMLQDFFKSSVVLLLDDFDMLPVSSFKSENMQVGSEINEGGNLFLDVQQLINKVSIFPIEKKDELLQLAIKYALEEASLNKSWIFSSYEDSGLYEQISCIANIPESLNHLQDFEDLIKSILDTTPQSLYMSLYRFIEKIYPWMKVSDLLNNFGDDMNWEQAAEILELKIRWYPREEQSLIEIFRETSPNLLAPIKDLYVDSQNIKSDDAERLNTPEVCAKFVYKLRNNYVHSRRGSRSELSRLDESDLIKICLWMIPIIIESYAKAYQ